MSLTARVKNKLIDDINTFFKTIGTTTSTRPAKVVKRNTAVIAWEFFIAKHLHTMASARRKKATEEAIAAGIIFDHEKHPREPGTDEIVYEDDYLSVFVTVSKPSVRINPDMLIKYLDTRIDTKLLDAAVKHATFETRPAHEFKAVIRTE